MQGDGGSTCVSLAFFKGVFRRAVASPKGRIGFVFIREGVDVNFFADHESRVETESKMTNNLGVFFVGLVLFNKLFSSRKCELGDVLFNLFGCHPNSRISNCKGLPFFIKSDVDAELFICCLRLSLIAENFHFANRVASI